MIFPNLEFEPIVQVYDRTRLSASKTFTSKDGPAIAKVEIEPEAGAGFIDVTNAKSSEWFTDYEYSSAGAKVITLQINGDTTPVTRTFSISIVTEASDALFATDQDLANEEPDVLNYVKRGRNTFKDVHREVQRQIVDMLNRKGYRTTDGQKIDKTVVVDKTEVREMAKYLALHVIFSGQKNQVADIHSDKAGEYWSKYQTATQRQILGLDLNKDGNVDTYEGVNLYTASLVQK